MRAQAHPLAQLRVSREHRRAPTTKALLEHLPELGVERRQLRRIAEPLAVRRIDHEQPPIALLAWPVVRQLASLEMRVARESGACVNSGDVPACGGDTGNVPRL